ncbi:MAG: hypothetical protein NTY88_13025 [Bacteroidetes bacterium]|nr:hypothetical protein [Bacteroidota bacterium]
MSLKLFWLKLCAQFVVLIGASAGIFYSTDAGYFDVFYHRIASSKQKSLIIGSSRAAQGLIPEVFNQKIKTKNALPVFNFAFTVAASPFGLNYLNSIKEKVEDNVTDGLFIVTIDPWCVSSDPGEIAHGYTREADFNIYKTWLKNVNPNVDYIIRENRRLGDLLFLHERKLLVHKDGWLEVTIPMDKISIEARTKSKLAEYLKHKQEYVESKARWKYLKETIAYLQTKGNVILVRLPIETRMIAIENSFSPYFSRKIQLLSTDMRVPFFDMHPLSPKLIFNDGNHISKVSAYQISEILADTINQIFYQPKNK